MWSYTDYYGVTKEFVGLDLTSHESRAHCLNQIRPVQHYITYPDRYGENSIKHHASPSPQALVLVVFETYPATLNKWCAKFLKTKETSLMELDL